MKYIRTKDKVNIKRVENEIIDGYPTGNVYVGLTLEEYHQLEEDLDKLEQYKTNEEELKCPLEFCITPYKLTGLKKIWYRKQWCEVVRIVIYEEATRPYMEVRVKELKNLKMVFLDDYKITWSLQERD